MSISPDCNYRGDAMSITNKLNQIKNAIYGKEVRGAIHDAIKQVYDDATVNHDNANMEVKMARGTHNTLNDRLNKTDEIQAQTNAQLSADIDIERKRIDSFVALPEGSTSGDAELMDIRIGANNVKYTNAGDAVRSQFMDANSEIKKIEDRFKYTNLLDVENLTMGFLDLAGRHFDASNYYYTDFIPFDSTMSVQLLRANNSNLFKATTYRQTNMRYVTTYDVNKNAISESGMQDVSTHFSTTDENVKYVRITILGGYIDDAKNNTMLTYGNTPPTQYSYIPNGYTLDKLISFGNGSELVGKRVLVLGDSIAYGAGSSGEGIASILAEKYGCTTKNYAVSGATVINSSNSILQQYDNVVADYTSSAFLCEVDYIIFDGGANDMVTDKLSELGSLSEYYGNEVTTDNFTGAFETLIRNLQTTFPNAKLIYFTNHHMPTRNKVNMDTYFNRAKDIMQKYGIEVVDIYSMSGLNTCIGTQHEKYCPDQTHPNKEGYLKFYTPYIVDAMKKCIC